MPLQITANNYEDYKTLNGILSEQRFKCKFDDENRMVGVSNGKHLQSAEYILRGLFKHYGLNVEIEYVG